MHLSFENIKFENLNLHLRFEEIAKDQQFTDKNIFKDTKFLFFAALLLNVLLLHFTNIFNLFIPRKVEINLISKGEIFFMDFPLFFGEILSRAIL